MAAKKTKKPTQNQIEAYLDDALGVDDMEAIEEALRSDAGARKRLEDSRRLHVALRKSRPEIPSERMWRRIRDDLATQHPARFPRAPVWERWGLFSRPLGRWAVGAACVALLVVGLSSLEDRTREAEDLARAEKNEARRELAAAAEKAQAEAASAPARTQPVRVAQASPPAASAPDAASDVVQRPMTEVERAGVGGIYGGGYCTYRDSEHFFSYRRDGTTGRMASIVWLKP